MRQPTRVTTFDHQFKPFSERFYTSLEVALGLSGRLARVTGIKSLLKFQNLKHRKLWIIRL
ncbi:hypothetical protein TorRG33x02_079640 [Trema orientale]|uniref:Uncharacterized protein n=1 Tax=Trema orientale TaxID=63057 RepID=A0A2P5FF02_TREOI|nr:hypothetical protein TorRG33x02_079640 [Trema orientale]